MSGADTRRFRRVPVVMEVHYRTTGSFLISYSMNLSKGGLFLETADLLPSGSTLRLRFTVPGTNHPFETEAKVMWLREGTSDDGLPSGLGVQFDRLDDGIGELIDSLVKDFAGVRLMAAAGDPGAAERLGRYLGSILHCNVITTGTAAEAFARLDERTEAGVAAPPDLVAIDLDSLGEVGLTLLRATKGISPAPPVVALSRDPATARLALDAGAAATLANPPSYERMRQLVLDLLGRPMGTKR
ncbi:MAG: TIGR02266 family protein [Deltaproteobacteria bacterium]|nr:TIGR02266 family protein [Deltaproteobacteria bacterium]